MRVLATTLASVALFLVLAAGGPPAGLPPAPLCEGCNIVVVSLDTLRADHVGCYGYHRPTTPNLDGFASASVLFEDAISQSAWTRPAHASMFTGLYPSEHGVVAMSERRMLGPDLPTLAASLSAAGYRTAAFTGGGNMSAHFGLGRGFDTYRSPGRRLRDSLVPALEWLDGGGTGPFFLFVHGFDSHRPYRSEPRDRRALGLDPKRAEGILAACKGDGGPDSMAPFVAEYDAAVHRGDRALGTLFNALGERGLFESTVVVVTSDHGEEFLEHGRCFHIHTLYAEVLRVPLVVYVPGLMPRRVAGVVPASASLAPTLLDVVGAGRNGLDGPSLAGVLAGVVSAPGEAVSETSSRYGHGQGHGHLRSITADGEKLIDWISRGQLEYFDLTADPAELRPRHSGSGMVGLKHRIEKWLEGHPRRTAGIGHGRLPQRLQRQLRAMGYIH